MRSARQQLEDFALRPLIQRTLATLCLLGLVGCAGDPVAEQYALEPIDHPDISGIEEVARQQLQTERDALDELIEHGTEARRVADSYGSMGELYQTYELFAPAIVSYRNAMLLDPQSFVWPYYLGVVQQREGNYAAALEAFEKALEQRPNDPAARQHLAEVQRALGQIEAANTTWQSLLEEDGYAAAANYALGLAEAEAARWPEAKAHFEAALELDPKANNIHHSLASVARQMGQSAIADTHQAAAGAVGVRSPDRLLERIEELAVTSGAYLKRGNQAFTRSDMKTAVTAFQRAVEINPDLIEGHRNLALAYAQQEDYDAALGVLKQAAAQHPDDLWLQFDLGTSYLALGLNEQAVTAFETAVEIDPEFVQGHFNLANTLIALDRWPEAQGHLVKVLQQQPEHRRARYLQAMANHRTGKSALAVSQLEAALQASPSDLTTRQGLAQVLSDLKRNARLRQVYTEGAQLDTLVVTERLAFWNQLAELEWRTRRRNQAIQAWRDAVKLDPKSSSARTNLGNGLQLLNRWPEARQHFAKAVEIDPSNAKAWRAETNLWILDKEFETASQRLDEALLRLPDDAVLLNTAARLLSTCELGSVRDGERALEMARLAYNLENSIDHAETISMALAELGQFEEAIQWQRRLLAQVGNSGDQRLLRRLATNLQLYENRRPLRTG